jgi:hypothetical protein
MEDKQRILDLLCETLHATRAQYDLQDLRYNAEKDTVLAVYENGAIEVNVAMDSGIAMIRDVLRAIE